MQQKISKKVLVYFFLLVIFGTLNNKNLDLSELLKIKEINIINSELEKQLTFLSNLDLFKKKNIFFLDKNNLKEKISENELVDNFSIFKKYPSTLLIKIDQTNFLKRKIGEELRLAWSGLTTARQRVTLLQNAVNIAAEVFNGRRKLREAGKETVINVLDAESGMFDARIQLVTAQHDARVAVYRLLASMGQLNIDTITNISGLSNKRKIASIPRIEKKNTKASSKSSSNLKFWREADHSSSSGTRIAS